MKRVNEENYYKFKEYARTCKQGKVYPLSITEGNQKGDIYVNSEGENKAVLFRHYCGFAFIQGEYDDVFLGGIYDILSDNINRQRFILLTDDSYIADIFKGKQDITIEKRYFYEYGGDSVQKIDLSDNCQLKIIDKELLHNIKGRITPYFSWDNDEDFLTNGRGYCLICDGEITAWAFSAAISNEEIDIGVEASEKFRGRGYATIVSKAMINHVIEQGKAPVWACHSENKGSSALAEKLGFIKTGEGFVIKRAE